MTKRLTAKTISENYAIPLPTVYDYVKRGILPAERIGGRLKFNPIKIEKVLKQGETQHARTW